MLVPLSPSLLSKELYDKMDNTRRPWSFSPLCFQEIRLHVIRILYAHTFMMANDKKSVLPIKR